MTDNQKEVLSIFVTEMDKLLLEISRQVHDLRWRLNNLEYDLQKSETKTVGIKPCDIS